MGKQVPNRPIGLNTWLAHGSIADFPIFKLINQFLGIVIGREAKGYHQYCARMKRLTILLIILSGCGANEPTYNLNSLKSDIESFDESERVILVNFSTDYEKTKTFMDSVSGVPVVLVPSLTYSEILEYIRVQKATLFTRDSLNYIKIADFAQLNGTGEIESISFQRWKIDENFLEQSGLQLTQGRNFSTAFNDELKVIISEPLANKLNIEIGETIELENTRTVIGIFENLPTNYPTTEHLIVAELKK